MEYMQIVVKFRKKLPVSYTPYYPFLHMARLSLKHFNICGRTVTYWPNVSKFKEEENPFPREDKNRIHPIFKITLKLFFLRLI